MSKTLTEHDAIKNWAESNGMKPAVVHDEEKEVDTSLLRFTDGEEDSLHLINWEHFFELFDANNLAVIVEEGSKFNKFVARDNNE